MTGEEFMATIPWPRLFRETARHPDNKRLLDELGAQLSALAIQSRPKDERGKPAFPIGQHPDQLPRQEA